MAQTGAVSCPSGAWPITLETTQIPRTSAMRYSPGSPSPLLSLRSLISREKVPKRSSRGSGPSSFHPLRVPYIKPLRRATRFS